MAEFPRATPERVERRLRNVARRRARELPLLEATGAADAFEPLPTRAQVIEWLENRWAAYERCEAEAAARREARLAVYRRRLAQLVGAERLAEMEAYAARVFPTAEYLPDYLCRQIATLSGEFPLQVFEAANHEGKIQRRREQ